MAWSVIEDLETSPARRQQLKRDRETTKRMIRDRRYIRLLTPARPLEKRSSDDLHTNHNSCWRLSLNLAGRRMSVTSVTPSRSWHICHRVTRKERFRCLATARGRSCRSNDGQCALKQRGSAIPRFGICILPSFLYADRDGKRRWSIDRSPICRRKPKRIIMPSILRVGSPSPRCALSLIFYAHTFAKKAYGPVPLRKTLSEDLLRPETGGLRTRRRKLVLLALGSDAVAPSDPVCTREQGLPWRVRYGLGLYYPDQSPRLRARAYTDVSTRARRTLHGGWGHPAPSLSVVRLDAIGGDR